MRALWLYGLGVFALPTLGAAQHTHSPYAGHEVREIKALSSEQVEGYLNGEGMGMALTAELNGYPGPRHVLELAEELALSTEQIEVTRRIFDSMKSEAVELGGRIVELERRLDESFARRRITKAELVSLTARIGELQGKLRSAHLQAHLGVAKLLSDAQKKDYDRLRGYGGH